jgi:glutamate carboxypeptidase
MTTESRLVAWALIALPLLQATCGPETSALHAAPEVQSPTAAERAITKYIDAHDAEALALLERVVDINSGTQNLAGVRGVGEVFRARLDHLGFQTKWVDGAAWQRAGHLVADHPGTGPRILLLGHIDTVFEKDSPFQKFERIDDATARGPGIIDMKGGDVIIVDALEALAAAGTLKTMNVIVVMTGDEEGPGRPVARAREALVAAAKGADIAICFEDGADDPHKALTARRGFTSWKLDVTGMAKHSSQIFRPDTGPGAIFEAARILDGFRQQLAGHEHLTFNPGIILGGGSVDYDAQQSRGSAFGKNNIVAEHVLVTGDLRALTGDQVGGAKQTMNAIASAASPHTQATLTFDDSYPPLPPTDGNARLLALYDRASQDLGLGTVVAADPDEAGAGDVAFVSGEAKMILDGVGLMGHDEHTPRETADLRTLPSQTKRIAVLLYRLTRPGTGVARP